MRGARLAAERVSEREPARADEVLHDQRRRESLHAWQCRQLLVVDAAVGVEIRRDDAQQVIRVADQRCAETIAGTAATCASNAAIVR